MEADLDVPCPLAETVEAKLVGDLGRLHGVGKILLVGEDEEEGVAQLVLVQHTVQLLTRLGHTLAIVRVDDEDDALCVLEVFRNKMSGVARVDIIDRESYNASRGDGSCPGHRHPTR